MTWRQSTYQAYSRVLIKSPGLQNKNYFSLKNVTYFLVKIKKTWKYRGLVYRLGYIMKTEITFRLKLSKNSFLIEFFL